MTSPPTRRLRITTLYPERLNLYADRGNVMLLAERARRRGIDVSVDAVTIGERFDPAQADLVYLGGGQDRDQRRCAADLQRHGAALGDSVSAGAVVLGICGGYQLLGHRYDSPAGSIPGVGLLDVTTGCTDGPRLVGDVVVELADGRRLVGFENHRGRTSLGPGATPLGVTVVGHGNDGDSGTEGAIHSPEGQGAVIGTYLHGPLLAKNTWFADHLLEMALGAPLPRLADRFGDLAHRRAVDRALGAERPEGQSIGTARRSKPARRTSLAASTSGGGPSRTSRPWSR